jgi:acetyl/propionyl-CoA carboxylase alpha subunit
VTFPIMIKAVAGGGGKGMVKVKTRANYSRHSLRRGRKP